MRFSTPSVFLFLRGPLVALVRIKTELRAHNFLALKKKERASVAYSRQCEVVCQQNAFPNTPPPHLSHLLVQEGKVLESVLAGRRRPPQSVTDLFLGLLFVLENGLYVTRHIHVCGRQGEEVQGTMRRWRRRGQLWVDEVLATLC